MCDTDGAVRDGVGPRMRPVEKPGNGRQLGDTGRADRVALGFQPAREIYRAVAVTGRLAVARRSDSLAALVEAQRFDCEYFRDSETVVDFGEVDVVWTDAGVPVGLFGGLVGGGGLCQMRAVLQCEIVAALSGAGDGDWGVQVVFLSVGLRRQDAAAAPSVIGQES